MPPTLKENTSKMVLFMAKRLNYEDLVQKALISVVRDLLCDAAKAGLPGNHHFYITYNTDHPDVEMPDYLREQYPESITIVVQYEFWDLKVFDGKFEISLSFNNLHERLVVPFNAMTSFVDPSAKFGLQFTPTMPPHSKKGEVKGLPESNSRPRVGKQVALEVSATEVEGNVISFDAFKKKN